MGKKFKIFVTDYFRRQINIDPKLLNQDIEVVLLQELDEKKLFPAISSADAIIVDKTPLTSYSIERLANCKIIIRLGVGYDNVDFQAAGKKGIYVCNVPDFCTYEVAEHTLALILTLCRNMFIYGQSLITGDVKGWNPLIAPDTIRLRGKTIGLIGLGRIGSSVCQTCSALGMEVLFYDPFVDASKGKKFGAKKVKSLEELAKKSDIVSLHLPLNEKTSHIAGEEFFSNLKRGAVLINTSRGGVVDTSALQKALKDGVVSKAGIDVLEKEPIDFTAPLFSNWLVDKELQKRLLITPHAAFYSQESTEEIKEKMIANIKRVFLGKKPVNCVNLKYLKK